MKEKLWSYAIEVCDTALAYSSDETLNFGIGYGNYFNAMQLTLWTRHTSLLKNLSWHVFFLPFYNCLIYVIFLKGLAEVLLTMEYLGIDLKKTGSLLKAKILTS